MKNKKLEILIMSGMISTGLIAPSIQANAETLNTKQIVEDNAINYNHKLSKQQEKELNQWINEIKNDKDLNIDKQGAEYRAKMGISEYGAGELIVPRAAKWITKHWYKIVEKAPNWVKPYLKFDAAMKVMRYYINISDTVDGFVWGLLRDLLPNWIPDPVVGGLKNTIMGLLPF